jgi:hypothetical protein
MEKMYLQLEHMTGKVFEYSKEAKEGYVEFTSTKGNISFRKYHKGFAGELSSVSIRDTNFGQELSISLVDGNNQVYFNVGLKDPKDFVDNNYCEDIIAKLPNMEKGQYYSINPYRFTPEGEKYARTGVSIKQGDLKIERAFTNSYVDKEGKKVDGDIPSVVWKLDATGKNKPSAASKEIRSDMFLEILATQAERLKWTSSNSEGSTTPTASTPTNTTKVPVTTDDSLDLPF